MQRRHLKIVAILIGLVTLFSLPASSQVTTYRLKTADSLFQAKKYTQSFEHYREMLNQKEYTPAMLLKMAFIQEGLGNIGQAMYYLNLYHLAAHDESTLEKMDQLAEKFSLRGYEPTESDRVLTPYRQHYAQISLALAAAVLLAVAGMFYQRVKRHQKPVGLFVLVALLICLTVGHVAIGEKPRAAILTASSTYIMEGPSGASSVVEVVKGGHKVQVLGHDDVWVKISWEGEEAYVRDHTIVPIVL